MSILLGICNVLEAVVDVLEYGPVEAAKINTSFCPEAERACRKIMKSSQKESYKTTTSFSETDSVDFTGIMSEIVSEVGKQRSADGIIDEIEEEAIRKAVEEKNCW